jgi:ATP-binding cassette, subfamily B, bacterial MsbA
MWKFLRPYLGRLAVAVCLTTLSAPIGLLLPLLTGKVIDATLLAGGITHLRQIVFLFLGLCVFLSLLSFGSAYLINSTGARLLRDLRSSLFSHVIGLSQDFHDSRRTGELLSRITSDLNQVQTFFVGTIPAAIPALISLFCIVALLFYIQFRLALAAMIIIPPCLLISMAIGRMLRANSTEQQDALADSTAFAEEALNGIRTIQIAGREFLETKRYSEKLGDLLGLQLKGIRRSTLGSALISAIQLMANTLVLWYGGYLVIKNGLSPGQLVSFMLLIATLRTALVGLSTMYISYQTMVGASVRIFEVLKAKPLIEDLVHAAPASLSNGKIVFENVRFCYPLQKDRLVLRGVHLEIQPNEIVGLVGPSGAGKSTLFSLLLRFYDPSEGSISIGGKDLRSIRLKDVRQAIGIVPQDIFLFRGTIGDNIAYFKPEATAEEIHAAAVAAGADEFIKRLPRRYDEFVGERGIKLSTGQRQRIAIARAFVTNPAILLLDEATSSLDADSEERVRQALSKLMIGRTTLVIAHRLATARQANRILVIEHGGIIGSGTHDVLYETNKLYQRFWELQSLERDFNNGNANTPSPGVVING